MYDGSAEGPVFRSQEDAFELQALLCVTKIAHFVRKAKFDASPLTVYSLLTHPEYNASLSVGVASNVSTDAIVVRVNIPRVPMSIGVSVPKSTRSCPKKSIAWDKIDACGRQVERRDDAVKETIRENSSGAIKQVKTLHSFVEDRSEREAITQFFCGKGE